MFQLTYYERKVLISIGILILLGVILRFYTKPKYSSSPNLPEKQVELNTSENKDALLSPVLAININTATSGELEKIPGIGPSIAKNIIMYRERYGLFSNVDDLTKVKGIGQKKKQAMLKYISF